MSAAPPDEMLDMDNPIRRLAYELADVPRAGACVIWLYAMLEIERKEMRLRHWKSARRPVA